MFGVQGGDAPGSFVSPTSINFDAVGNFFVSEFRGSRVQAFTVDGGFIGEVAPGTFNGPHGLAFDDDGRLFVADTGNDAIRVFTVDR